MSLSYEEIEKNLNKIFTGKEFINVNDMLLEFRFPSAVIKQKASMIFEKAREDAIKQGMLSKEDLEALVEKRNLISAAEILKLKKLYSQLEAQEVLLGKTTLVKANQDRIKQVINRLRHDINEIEYKKNSKLLISADVKAEEERSFYLCSRCVYKEDGNLLWATHKDACAEKNIEFKDRVLINYIRMCSGVSTPIVRELSRSIPWRIRYINSMKTSDPLFGVPTSEYTTDQLNLVYWSNYYQNIFDMMPEDRPSDMVIEDDDALDAFMKNYYEDRNRQEASRKHKNRRSGKLSAFDAEEVIVTRSHELYQDIEYDKPKEAQKLKDRTDIKKRTRRG
jgi:hypothetical protein